MNKFEKNFFCQKKAKEYGLKDIALIFDKDANFPFYGLLIAEKITYDYDKESPYFEYVSYFKEDRKKGDFQDTLAYKLLFDDEVLTPCCSCEEKEEDGERIKVEKYKLIYFNSNASFLKPTVYYTYNPKDLKDKKITCEYTFVFDNKWIYTYEEVVGQGPQEEFCYPFGHFDNICDTLNDIKDFRKGINPLFFNSSTSSIKKNDKGEDIEIELEVFNINGEYNTLNIPRENWKNIPNALCSIRLVNVENENKFLNNKGNLFAML